MNLLSNKQIRMLELLDEKIQSCEDCNLYNGGRAKPYWTPLSEYVAIGEAPGRNEVTKNEPFVGKAGEILIYNLQEHGLRKEQFAIINSVNCRPTIDGKNGKPNDSQLDCCFKWIRKFITVINPEKIITFGVYAMKLVGGPSYGITNKNATTGIISRSLFGKPKHVLYSIHPAYCIYNKDAQPLLYESIRLFKMIY